MVEMLRGGGRRDTPRLPQMGRIASAGVLDAIDDEDPKPS